MHNLKELKVWQKSRLLIKEIYWLVKKFPIEEKYGLINQIQRSAISISSNIAEGSGRNSEIDFNRFLDIAYGSACELETQIILAFDIGYINESSMNKILEIISEIHKMLFVFKEKLQKKQVS